MKDTIKKEKKPARKSELCDAARQDAAKERLQPQDNDTRHKPGNHEGNHTRKRKPRTCDDDRRKGKKLT